MAKSPALALHTSLFLIFFGFGIAGCGGGSMMSSARQMQSITVTPASADAQNFPGGKVQFTAMGTFNMAPITVQSPPVMWSIGSPFGPPPNMPAASVDANGVAQCNGFVGTAIVEATAPTEPQIPLLQMTSMTITVSGSGQLICP